MRMSMINWNVLLDILSYEDLVEFNSSEPICPKCGSSQLLGGLAPELAGSFKKFTS